MCSRRRSVLVAAALAVAGAVSLPAQTPVQGPARERALLARAESLLTWSVRQDSIVLAQRRTVWQARPVEHNGLVIVLPSVVSIADAKRGLDSASVLLREFGAIPEVFTRSLALYNLRAIGSDSVLAQPQFRTRLRVQLGLTGTVDGRESIDGWDVGAAVMKAFAESRDSTWATWLPAEFGIGGWPRNHAWGAYRELTESPWSVGVRCVAGQPAGCRLWLGLDRDSAPYAMRYTVADLRGLYAKEPQFGWFVRSERAVACVQGDDDACVAHAIRSRNPDEIPANGAGAGGFHGVGRRTLRSCDGNLGGFTGA
jgi:hypothetical protein